MIRWCLDIEKFKVRGKVGGEEEGLKRLSPLEGSSCVLEIKGEQAES